MTIFLTTQYLEEVDRLAQEVAIINNGKIIVRGTPAALKREIGNEVITVILKNPEAPLPAVEFPEKTEEFVRK